MSRSSRPQKTQNRAPETEPGRPLTSGMTVPVLPAAGGPAAAPDFLQVILGNIADGVTAQGPDGKLLYANDTAAKIVGCATGKEMVETPIQEILSRFEMLTEDGRPFDLNLLPSRLVLMGSDHAEARVKFRIRKTGEIRASEVKATAIRDADGKLFLMANVFHDITALKLAEDDIQRSESNVAALRRELALLRN